MPVIDFNATMCKHCYKCVRNCDVKAIMVRDGRAIIMPNRCVVCGQCVRCCPQSAKVSSSELELVKSFMADGHRVIVSLSSSFMSLFPSVRPGQMKGALLELGFSAVRDVSEGAALVTEEYIKLLREGKMENIITSLCPSINDLIEIYYPQLIPYVAQVDPPSIAHAKLIKAEDPDARVVFIGPCAAKKLEAMRKSVRSEVDFVLTFEEMAGIFAAKHVDLTTIEEDPDGVNDASTDGRSFAVGGGVAKAVVNVIQHRYPGREVKVASSQGLRECRKMMQEAVAGKYPGYLLEGMACPGGCVAGAGTMQPIKKSQAAVGLYARQAKHKTSDETEHIKELDKLVD